MEFIKKNITVLLAFLLPILLVLGLAISVFLPGLFLSTQYNFVYATCDIGLGDYRYYPDYPPNCTAYLNSLYKVEKTKLVIQAIVSANGRYIPHLFIHDTTNNESREITFAEANDLRLSGLLTSPDGVSVDSGYDRGDRFFMFDMMSSNHDFYLTKGREHHRLNLINSNGRYDSYNNFKFIGWVVPN